MEEKERAGCCENNLVVWTCPPPSDNKAESSGSRALCYTPTQLVGKSYGKDDKVIEWINERLQILEQEAENMKQDFLVGVEERRKLIDETHQQFQIIRCRLSDKATSGDHKYATTETGLLQVIRQDSNPSLVTSCFRNKRFKRCSRD